MVRSSSAVEEKTVEGSVINTATLKLLLIISLYYPLSIGLTFYQKAFLNVSYT